MADTLVLKLRRQQLQRDRQGCHAWHVVERVQHVSAAETAVVLCDVWDRHWCRGAQERLTRLLPRINAVARSLRTHGALIVHAPSGTIGFYRDSPAQQRVLDAPPAAPPDDVLHPDPALPVDATHGGCDTDDNFGAVNERVWTRQHPAIEINHVRDAISDDGRALYSLYRHVGIQNLIIMGVHANMCILNRSFAIKQMIRWGFAVALVRDLTDAMYDPAYPPYVSHDEGTRLMLDYVEKFWCPTLSSADLA